MPKKIVLPAGKKIINLNVKISKAAAPYVSRMLASRAVDGETETQTAHRLLVEMAINHRTGEAMEEERQAGDSHSAPIGQIVGQRQMDDWNKESAELKKKHGKS